MLLLATGCGARSALDEGAATDGGTRFDARMPDARVPDAGPDANRPDAFVPDAGPDASFPDAGPDASFPDAFVPDASFPDAFVPDAGPDASFPDAGPDASFPDAGPDAGPDASFPDAGTGESGCDGIDDDGDGTIDEGWAFVPVAPPSILSPTGDADRGNGDVWRTATGFHATWWETDGDGRTVLRHVELDDMGRPVASPAPYPGVAGTAPGARGTPAPDDTVPLGYCTDASPTRRLARVTRDGTVLAPDALRTQGADATAACGAHPPFALTLAGRPALLYATDRTRLLISGDPGPDIVHTFDGTPAPDARPFVSMDDTGGFVATPIVFGSSSCLAVDRIALDGTPLFRVGCFDSGDPAQPLANTTAARTESGATLFVTAIRDTPGVYTFRLQPDGTVLTPLSYYSGSGDVNLEPELVAVDGDRLVYASSACQPLCNIKVFLYFPSGFAWTGLVRDGDDEGFVAEPRLAHGGDFRVAMTYFSRNPGGEDAPSEIRSVVYDCVEVP